MKTRKKLLTAVSSLAIAAMVLLTGCGGTAQSEVPEVNETGVITLSVNPEIKIEYDKDGLVTGITGANDDGKAIVEAYPDYIGKECRTVLAELIAEINEAGYFIDDIDGHEKNIVIQLEPGSIMPSEDFLTVISDSTREAVKNLKLGSGIVTIDDDDYDQSYAKEGQPSRYITLAKAQEIALAQAGVSAKDAVFEDKEFDHDDGTPVFELEFKAGGVEYEYDVHAVTGKVIKAQHEKIKAPSSSAGSVASSSSAQKPATSGGTGGAAYQDTDYGPGNDGVTDYNNTDYGPNNDGVTDYHYTDYNSGNSASGGVSSNHGGGDSGYDNGDSGYNNSGYGNTGYDDGNTGYDDGDSGYDNGDSGYDD